MIRSGPIRIAVFIVAVLAAGCGAEGTPAPTVEVEAAACPTLDGTIPQTLAALREGRAAQLADVLETLAAERPEAADGFMTGLLALLAEVWNGGLNGHPEVLEPLADLLDDLTPLLSSALAYLAEDGWIQNEALEMTSELLVQCPSGSLTGALAVALERPEMLRSLAEALADPLVQSVIVALPDDGGGSGGVEGFVALMRTIIKAINNPNFVFSDLVGLLDAVGLPTDEPPMSDLMAELQILLTGENLETVRQLTVCLDESVVVGAAPGHTGTEAFGALLYGLLTDEDVRLGDQLAGLLPAVSLLDDPTLMGIVDALLKRLAEDESLREGLKPAMRYLLEPANARGALADLADLIDAGLVPELLSAVITILGECQAGGTP